MLSAMLRCGNRSAILHDNAYSASMCGYRVGTIRQEIFPSSTTRPASGGSLKPRKDARRSVILPGAGGADDCCPTAAGHGEVRQC